MALIFGVLVLAFLDGPTPPTGAVQRTEMFPDGLDHHFGKVAQGSQCKRTFRIVNTRSVPLTLVSLRTT